MKILEVKLNNKKKSIDVLLSDKRVLTLPLSQLDLKPSAVNPIVEIFVDRELGGKGITYFLKSGKENSVPMDAFLDYNKDPEYLKKILLYKITLEAQSRLKKSSLSKNEITRRLKTSPSQLSRLLDPTNKTKTFDNMLKLLAVLGCEVELKFKTVA